MNTHAQGQDQKIAPLAFLWGRKSVQISMVMHLF
jgi:hypothetical protein